MGSNGESQFNTHPQPRTFAPSKEDVLQNLQYFFGAPVSPEKLKDYSEHHAVTHHFPDAYAGQNTSAHSHQPRFLHKRALLIACSVLRAQRFATPSTT